MNKNSSLPELVVILVVGLVMLGMLAVRTWWASRRTRLRGPADVQRQRYEHSRETERQRVRLIAGCVLLVLISVPLIFKVVPPNGTYGFRLPSTRSNPTVWYAANAFMGWAVSIAAVVAATALFALPATVKRWLVWAVFLFPMLSALAASLVYVDRIAK